MILCFHFQKFPFASASALLTRTAAGPKQFAHRKKDLFPPTVQSADFREILDQIVVCHLFALDSFTFMTWENRIKTHECIYNI